MHICLLIILCSTLINYSYEHSFSIDSLIGAAKLDNGMISKKSLNVELADLMEKSKLQNSNQIIHESVVPELLDLQMIIKTLMSNYIQQKNNNETDLTLEKKNGMLFQELV